MNAPTEVRQGGQLSDYLAAERTVLAWIRTGLALMGFGFVVARFGLFLREIHFAGSVAPAQSYGLSLWFGTALIAAGVAVNVFAGWRHARLTRDLDRGGPVRSRSASVAVAIAFFLALVGLAMAIYLVSLHGSKSSGFSSIPRIGQEAPMEPASSNGIVTLRSNHSVDDTIEKLKTILQAKGVTVFALVDHGGEAQKAGFKMPPTKLLIFGSPKGGTPIMLAAPTAALDLPLKILVAQDSQGGVWLSYNSSAYLQQRHAIPPDLLPPLAVVQALADQVTK
ncbi:MAG: DUF302 domain-containing protein [Candidatus Acidiferrales bacterium]